MNGRFINKINALHLFISGTFFFKIIESTVSFIPPIYKLYLPATLFIGFYIAYPYLRKIQGSISVSIFLISLFSYFIILLNVLCSDYVDLNGVTPLDFHLVLLFSIPAFFMYGISISRSTSFNLEENNIDRSVVFLLALVIFLNVNFQYFRLDFESFKYDKAVYLFLGDILSIIGLYYVSIAKGTLNKAIYFSLFLLLLFVVYSRTSLYFFAFTVFAGIFISSSGRRKICYLLPVVFFALIIISLSETLSHMELPYSLNRMLFVFSGSDDGSLNGREMIFEGSLRSLENSLLLGDFGNQIDVFGYWSFYIHNVLSYLRQFGLIAFIFVIIMLLLPLIFFTYRVHVGRRLSISPLYMFGFLVSFYLLCIYVFSRSYMYPYIYLMPGYFIGVVCSEKKLYLTNR